MDDQPSHGASIDQPAFELLDDTRRYALTREVDGYAIWDLESTTDAPISTFPLDDDGERDARDEFARLAAEDRRARLVPRILLWTAGTAGIVWLVTTAIFAIEFFTESPFDGRGQWLSRVQGVESFANVLFFVSIGLYVVLWLDRRRELD